MSLLRILLLWIAVTATIHAESGYRFRINGKVQTPPVFSLHGTPQDPQPGDMVQVLLVRV